MKRGFTLVEILLSIGIIGIISVLTFVSTKNMLTNNYSKFYYAAYDIVKKAGYSAVVECNNAPSCFFSAFNQFHPILESQVNIVPGSSTEGAFTINNTNIQNIGNTDPNFIISNGMRFWLSNAYYFPNIIQGASPFVNCFVYIIFVDLNGPKGPNRYTYNPNRDKEKPDIVPFILTERGDVIPFGLPEFDPDYFIVRVDFPDTVVINLSGNDEVVRNRKNITLPIDPDTNPKVAGSPAMTLHQAKTVAWGVSSAQYGQDENQPLSLFNADTGFLVLSSYLLGNVGKQSVSPAEVKYWDVEYNSADTNHGCRPNVSPCKITPLRK